MSRRSPYPPPLPENLHALTLTRIDAAQWQHGPPTCDLCDAPAAYVIRTTYGEARVEHVTHLCVDNAGGFMEQLTDRLGPQDA